MTYKDLAWAFEGAVGKVNNILKADALIAALARIITTTM